ncbi:Cupredoxin [Microdochium trichocladiopsis]|uniref:Cupredoxin n=1 Tax=Microdochium trichocladiopsis TaxID=1682393 RepID=A0A9P9BPJ8_9PEZI|nr:Cupredoxin [Microdochium trichocladiopsis]KAH7024626.1 Cupredoxin [Microdochium trichocladiopsis]
MPSLQLLPLFLGLAAAAKHRIDVGKGGLKFEPNTTTAAVGDTIEFHFYPERHSVARGIFDKPCEAATTDGFYSGYFNVTTGEAKSVFEVKVDTTDPIWIYCTAARHCESGMVGVINAKHSDSNSTNTLEAYAAAAKAYTGLSQVPPDVFGGEVKALNSTGGSSTKSHTGTHSPTGTATASDSGATMSMTATGAAGSASASATHTAAAADFVPQGVGILLAGMVAAVVVS